MSVFKKMKQYWDWGRIYNNVKFLIKFDLLEEKYKIKDETIEDCIYEFDELKNSLVFLKVLNEAESVDVLAREPKSFARYGDGEIDVMKGKSVPFQNYDADLAYKMKEQLIRKRDDLYIGLNSSYFQSPTKYSDRNRRFYRLYGTPLRRFFNEVCDQENTYLDACCFCGYFRQGDSFDLDAHFKKVKDLFKGKPIAIVCGEGILDNLENDLFELCTDKIMIPAPRRNAFEQYDRLIAEINEKVPKNYLVCVILGMTATALVGDLAKDGYIAWDIGHAPQDYDAYMRKVEKTEETMDKFYSPD